MDLSALVSQLQGRFLPGKPKAQPSISLIIRPASVGAVYQEPSGLVRHATAPVADADEASLTAALRDVLQALKAPGSRAAISLMSPEVLVRFFSMPAMPKGEGETAAQFEVRKYIPFKLETLAWDVHLGGQSDNRMDVVFAAMPRDPFDRLLRAVTAAGIQASVVEPCSMSLARLAAQAAGPEAQGQAVCVIDIGKERCSLVIAREGVPHLMREFGSGGPAADAALAESEPPLLKRLVGELRVSMDFFLRECPGQRIGTIVLLGDDPGLAAWCAPLSAEVGCRVQVGGLHGALVPGGVPLSLASALGAIAEPKAGSPTLNFLKRSAQQESAAASKAAPKITFDTTAILGKLQNPQILATVVASVVTPVALCVALGMRQVSQQERLLAEAKLVVQQAPHPALNGMDQAALQPIRDKATKQMQLLRTLIDQRTGVAARLDALARALPEGVWITSLQFEDPFRVSGKREPQLSVAGACYLGTGEQEFGAIQAFQERIRKDPTLFHGFGSAQVEQITAQSTYQREYSYRTFQLQCDSERSM